jgi:uncharacterized protein
MTKPLCIYHSNCADGFGAAYAVKERFGGEVEFHAGVHGDDPPEVTGRNVIIVDFSYKLPVLKEMGKKARTITILDHHKTAADDLMHFATDMSLGFNGFDDFSDMAEFGGFLPIRALFDMNRSGAMIAWNYFHPGTRAPKLIDHIQDRDLWLFKLDGTREIQANVFSYPYNFDVWDKLMESDVQLLRSEGAAIERKHHKDIAELIAVTKRRMVIGGHDVPVANLPYTLSSDAGYLMAQGEPFAACYWDTPDGRVFSLRSSDDGVDVSEIAKKYGGGGHQHAAGFRMPLRHVTVLLNGEVL